MKRKAVFMKIILQHLSSSLPDKTELKDSLSQNRIQVTFAIVLLIGVVCGSLLSRSASLDILKKLDFIFNSNYTLRSSTSALSVFGASLASSFLFVLICFLFGLSVWGAFLVPFIPFIRGIGLGMTAGYLYSAFGFHGGLFYAIILLPGAYCSCFAIILATKNALIFSRILSRASLSQKGETPKFLNYVSQFTRVLILIFLGAGLDALLAWTIAKFMIALL
jgi:stage II sporulation protein M